MNPLAAIFVQAIKETGLTDREISRRSGVHHNIIHRLRTGKIGGSIDTWALILGACRIQIGTRRVD